MQPFLMYDYLLLLSRPASLVASASLGAAAFGHTHAPLETSASVSGAANAFSTSLADLGLSRAARGNKLLHEGSSRLHNLISPSASVNVMHHFSSSGSNNYDEEDGHHQQHEVSPRQQHKKMLFRTSTNTAGVPSSSSGGSGSSGNSKRPLSIKEEAGLPGEASPPQIPTRKR